MSVVKVSQKFSKSSDRIEFIAKNLHNEIVNIPDPVIKRFIPFPKASGS